MLLFCFVSTFAGLSVTGLDMALALTLHKVSNIAHSVSYVITFFVWRPCAELYTCVAVLVLGRVG